MSMHRFRSLAVYVFAAKLALPAPAGAQDPICFLRIWEGGYQAVCIEEERVPELLEQASARLREYVTGSIDAYQEGTAIGFAAFRQWYDRGGWWQLKAALDSWPVAGSGRETEFVFAVLGGLARQLTQVTGQTRARAAAYMQQCGYESIQWLTDRTRGYALEGESRTRLLQRMAPDVDAYVARFEAVGENVLSDTVVTQALQFEFVLQAAAETDGLGSNIERAVWTLVGLPPPGERTASYYATRTLTELILSLARYELGVDATRLPWEETERLQIEALYEAIRVLHPDNLGLRCGVFVPAPRTSWRPECREGTWTLTTLVPFLGFEPLR
ncbi:MAG: hypothetical protein JSW46_05515 [Gemmatimonadota bacterium]|nr:MAG: hypothetical protein JSW46_05515 [Gemmatimonadota bacterium]